MHDVLNLNGKIYSIHHLEVVDLSPFTHFEKSALLFCSDWLNGKTFFEIQTSGSTGKPKTIKLERSSMIVSAMATAQAIHLKAGQTSLVCLDVSYIAGIMMLVRSMEVGMNMIAVEPCANPLEKIGSEDKIHFAALVPYQVKTILDSPQKDFFNRIETIIVGGAPLDESTKKQLQDFSCQFYETYGMTETISHIALKKINGKGKSEYFEILPGISIWQDERACLCIKAPYLREDVITNDVVEMKNLQEFIWLGRFDNVINSGGVKIFPESTEKKIENIFAEQQLSNRFFLAGLPDEKWGQKVALMVEGSIEENAKRKLEETLKLKLSKFEIPKSIQFIEKFSETENGKVNRKSTIASISSSSEQSMDAQGLL
jgi:o-succinylbenzoate---CoA ligase